MPEETKEDKRLRIANRLHNGLDYSLGIYEFGAQAAEDPKLLDAFADLKKRAPTLAGIAYNDDDVQAAYEVLVQNKFEVQKASAAINAAHGNLEIPEIIIDAPKDIKGKGVDRPVILKGLSVKDGPVEITLKGEEADRYRAAADRCAEAEQALASTYDKCVAAHKGLAGNGSEIHDVLKQSMVFAAQSQAEELYQDRYITQHIPAYDAQKESLLVDYRKGQGATTSLPYKKIAARADDKGSLAI
jgi:hypothetical protein